MLNRKITTLVLVLILAIIAVGWWWAVKIKQSVVEDNNQNNNIEKTDRTATTTEEVDNKKTLKLIGVDDNGWNIYKSEKYEFRIDQTLDYKIKENSSQSIYILFNSIEEEIGYKNEIEIFIINNTSIEKQRKRLENIFNLDKIFQGEVLLNNMQGEEYEYFDEMLNFHDLILLFYPGEEKSILWLRLISENKSKEAINIFKGIINTFKLLK